MKSGTEITLLILLAAVILLYLLFSRTILKETLSDSGIFGGERIFEIGWIWVITAGLVILTGRVIFSMRKMKI
jgi:hypothetical protein